MNAFISSVRIAIKRARVTWRLPKLAPPLFQFERATNRLLPFPQLFETLWRFETNYRCDTDRVNLVSYFLAFNGRDCFDWQPRNNVCKKVKNMRPRNPPRPASLRILHFFKVIAPLINFVNRTIIYSICYFIFTTQSHIFQTFQISQPGIIIN